MKNFDSKTALVLSKKLSFSSLNSFFFDCEIARFISQNLFLKNLGRFLLSLLVLCGCADYYPKPKGFLRVDASETVQSIDSLSFARFSTATGVEVSPEKTSDSETWINLRYPYYQAELYGTYHTFSNKDGLERLSDDFYDLLDRTAGAEKLYYAHYDDSLRATYGYLYWSDAPIPSPVQFFVTDSLSRFFRGAVYFSDSLSREMQAPYSRALSDEMMRLIETFNWK